MSELSSSYERPLVTVVIPALNAASTLPACLDGLRSSDYPNLEVILVSDASTDRTAEVAADRGVHVLTNHRRCGPAYSRNAGAAAGSGEIIYFVDADVVLAPTAISQAVACLSSGEADAVFGSYMAETRVPGFYSKFKNYQHHYHHQQSSDYVDSFWSGSGAITRRAFEALEGFDVELEACEDIEFGHALSARGFRVRLIKTLLAEHLKPYTFRRLMQSELWGRAVPWTRLARSGRARLGILNTKPAGMWSTALTGLSGVAVMGSALLPELLAADGAFLAGVAYLNRGLLAFVRKKRGSWFAARALAMLLLHYGICGTGFVLGHLAPRHRPHRSAVVRVEEHVPVNPSDSNHGG